MKPLEEFWQSGSPYLACYSMGLGGHDLQEVVSFFNRNGVQLREKDIQNWENGHFKYSIEFAENNQSLSYQGGKERSHLDKSAEKIISLSSFPKFPENWNGCLQRFFPCNKDNKPKIKWGYSQGYIPTLTTKASAIALSDDGLIGQNMLYQPFVVIDIDGNGHGDFDLEVITFGNTYRDKTTCMEDPAKPGSFHLYFSTDRIIPTYHFPWAKLDFMGNANNYAVYLKRKVSNGLPMMKLDQYVWQAMMNYQAERYKKGATSVRS